MVSITVTQSLLVLVVLNVIDETNAANDPDTYPLKAENTDIDDESTPTNQTKRT